MPASKVLLSPPLTDGSMVGKLGNNQCNGMQDAAGVRGQSNSMGICHHCMKKIVLESFVITIFCQWCSGFSFMLTGKWK